MGKTTARRFVAVIEAPFRPEVKAEHVQEAIVFDLWMLKSPGGAWKVTVKEEPIGESEKDGKT